MSFDWKQVAIGGGGYVTNIHLHPLEKDLAYIKTDIGGFYRWNPLNNNWVSLTDKFTNDQSNYYGGESIALDPTNTNNVYIAAGKNTASWAGLGTIFKSSDRGSTWIKLNIDLAMGGNETKRWTGERLQINPYNPAIIFFGSRLDGLWKSTNYGQSWYQQIFPGVLTNNIGITDILFSKKVAGLMYANAYNDGIYKSTDTGISWTKITGSPTQTNRMCLNSSGVLYVTHNTGVSKYNNNVWSNITPTNVKTLQFNGLSIDSKNDNHILITYNQYQQIGNYSRVFRSIDGGVNWQQKTHTLNSQVFWYPDYFFGSACSNIQFDPFVNGKVWLTDWYSTWQAIDITVEPCVWSNYEKGHEEIVTFDLCSPPTGSLLISGIADVEGFNHDQNLDVFPNNQLGGINSDHYQETYSIAYNELEPLKMVRVGGYRSQGVYGGSTSIDGGHNWTEFLTFPINSIPQRVTMSATNSNNYVVTISQKQPIVTNNNGQTWQTITGLPNAYQSPWYWGQQLTSDKINGNIFYYYMAGKFYKSVDSGLTFSLINSSLPNESWCVIKTFSANEIWLSLDSYGLYRSINGGVNFTKITTVEKAHLFSFGKPQIGTIPVLYLYGKVTGVTGNILSSTDLGQTWNNISDVNNPIGNVPNVMEASKQEYGLVFIGTNGKGIYYGKP